MAFYTKADIWQTDTPEILREIVTTESSPLQDKADE